MGWQNGRQLARATNGTNSLSFEYDVNGIRTKKIIDGVEHTCLYNGTQLLVEKWGNTILEFQYNANGTPYSVRRSLDNGSTFSRFYYLLNVQGDVAAIINQSGQIVARYTYDAWGKVVSVTGANGVAITNPSDNAIANLNPLRYRGYYYDRETGLYYCQSRYYDPEVGRFINSDSYASTGQGFLGWNMFAYCNSDPINSYDPSGHLHMQHAGGGGAIPVSTSLARAAASGVISALAAAFEYVRQKTKQAFDDVVNQIESDYDDAMALISALGTAIATKVKESPTQNYNNHNHHIVAQTASNAMVSRAILDYAGIELRSSQNLVPVNAEFHSHLHTDIYYAAVNNIMITAFLSGGTEYQRKSNITLALAGLHATLTACNKLLS